MNSSKLLLLIAMLQPLTGCADNNARPDSSATAAAAPQPGQPLTERPTSVKQAATGTSSATDLGDWPGFRGTSGLGVSAETGIAERWSQEENLLWKTELPGAGASSPIVSGGRVFVTCYSGYGMPGQTGGSLEQLKRHVVCLDPDSGKTLWDKPIAAKLPEERTIREGHGYASSTPVADSQRLYVFFGKSGVFAFDHDGQQLWHADVGSKTQGWGSAASPMLAADLVIVNASVESQSIVALDKRTGQQKWRAEDIRESWNMPVLVPVEGAKTELVVAITGKVLGLDPASGAGLWSCATDIQWYMVPGIVADQGIIYCIGGRTGGSLAVRAGGRGEVTQSHRLWTGRKGSNVSSPILHEGRLYWAHENLGIAYCAEAKTGQIVYEERLPRAGQIYASPVIADGKLYYVSRSGRTFVLRAKPKFELLATNDLGNRSQFNASPAIAAGRLFLRSDRYLYCIGARR